MNDWIEEEFGDVQLGDQRLNERLRRLLASKWQHPQRSMSAACHGRAEIEAASRFFDNPKADPVKILAAHRAAIVERIREGGYRRVLLVQDTSECDYTTHKKLQGSGPLAGPERRGFFAHNLLVVTPDERVPLGLWDTIIYARDDAADGTSDPKHRPIEQKETFRWLEGFRAACTLAGWVRSGLRGRSRKRYLRPVRRVCTAPSPGSASGAAPHSQLQRPPLGRLRFAG